MVSIKALLFPQATTKVECRSVKRIKYPDARIGVLDPRGSRQMDMPACSLGSLPTGIKNMEET